MSLPRSSYILFDWAWEITGIYFFRSDLAYFDGLHETILSVGLVKPKAGVFKPYIEHLLCLTTTSEIVLLGVSFSQPSDGEWMLCVYLTPSDFMLPFSSPISMPLI